MIENKINSETPDTRMKTKAPDSGGLHYGSGIADEYRTVRNIEEELRKSEERYRLLVENSGIGVGYYSLDGEILYFNSKAVQNLGGKPEDYIGRSLHEVFGKEAGDVYLKRIRAAANSEVGLEYEDFVPLQTGNYWFLSNHTRVLNPDGTIAGVQALAQDITNRKVAEEKLKNSERNYRTVLDNIHEALIIQDADANLVYANPEFSRMFGYSADEFKSLSCKDYTAPEWYDEVIERHRLRMKGIAVAEEFEYEGLHKNGSKLWIEARVTVLMEEGKIIGTQSLERNITERKQSLELIRKSEFQYRLLADNMTDMVWLMDLSLNLTYVSPSVEKIRGYTLEELQSTPLEEKLTPASYRRLQEIVSREMPVILSNPDYSNSDVLDLEFYYGDRSTFWLEIVFTIIYDYNKIPNSILCVGRDITEHKKTSDKLKESEERLDLFFSQSLDGFFFMMLDEPVIWNDEADKEKILDFAMTRMKLTKINKAMLDQYGATEDQFIGRTIADFFAHDTHQGREIIRKIFNNGHLHSETREMKLDGTDMIIEGDYICSYDLKNRLTGHFGIQRDITERKQDELKIKHQLEELQRWQMVTLGREGRIRQMKQEVNELLLKLGEPARYSSQEKIMPDETNETDS
jgi:PAS domain S-box-containing protein